MICLRLCQFSVLDHPFLDKATHATVNKGGNSDMAQDPKVNKRGDMAKAMPTSVLDHPVLDQVKHAAVNKNMNNDIVQDPKVNAPRMSPVRITQITEIVTATTR